MDYRSLFEAHLKGVLNDKPLSIALRLQYMLDYSYSNDGPRMWCMIKSDPSIAKNKHRTLNWVQSVGRWFAPHPSNTKAPFKKNIMQRRRTAKSTRCSYLSNYIFDIEREDSSVLLITRLWPSRSWSYDQCNSHQVYFLALSVGRRNHVNNAQSKIEGLSSNSASIKQKKILRHLIKLHALCLMWLSSSLFGMEP